MTDQVAPLLTCISLAALVAFILTLYRDVVQDEFRQRMFALRDELFDLAITGVVTFDHPAYETMRTMMNGFIRFAHRMSFLNMLFLVISLRSDDQEVRGVSLSLEEAFASLPNEQRRVLENVRVRMNYLTVRYLVWSSPTLALLLGIPSLLLRAKRRDKNELTPRLNRPLRKMDAVAYATGAANGVG